MTERELGTNFTAEFIITAAGFINQSVPWQRRRSGVAGVATATPTNDQGQQSISFATPKIHDENYVI